MVGCRFCREDAVARFRLGEGCVVYPGDREQDLCWHHAREATPLGTFELVEDYTLPGGDRAADLMQR